MAHVLFARNIIDANVNDAAAVLPAVNSTTFSNSWDLGPATHEDGYEIACDLPLLTTTHLVNAQTTLKLSLVSSDTDSDLPNWTQVDGTEKTVTGTGSNIAAASYRWKVPSTASRYVSVRFVLLGAGSNAATANATNVGLRF